MTQRLIDPQGVDVATKGGIGMVAMLYFTEDDKNVTVEYHSTVQEKFFMNDNRFSFEVAVVKEEETPVVTTEAPETEVDVTETEGSDPETNDGSMAVAPGGGGGAVLVMGLTVVLITKKRKIAK